MKLQELIPRIKESCPDARFFVDEWGQLMVYTGFYCIDSEGTLDTLEHPEADVPGRPCKEVNERGLL